MIYFPNFIKISQYVKDGTLDAYMTKAVSLQFIISVRYIDFGWAFPNIIAGVEMIVVAFIRLNIAVSLMGIMGFVVFIISSIILAY